MSVFGRLGAAVVAASALVLVESPAFAVEEVDVDWRQNDRTDHYLRKPPDYPHFLFELRMGPYWPKIDTEPALHGAKPYQEVFGTGAQFYLGFEIDWEALRIPYVGAIGPGFGWAWTAASAKAVIELPNPPKLPPCTGTLNGCASDEDTSITIFPMYAVAVVRIDELMLRTGMPIVPFAKFGVASAIWTSGTSTGKVYTDPTCTAGGKAASSCEVAASGISWGPTFALGGALSLNWVDPDAVARSREASGVKNFYAFGEWFNYMFSTAGEKQLRVGSSSWIVGVAVDF